MKRKLIIFVMALAATFACALGVSGCTLFESTTTGSTAPTPGTGTTEPGDNDFFKPDPDDKPDTHDHIWDTDWTIGEATHYHACIVAGCTEKNDEAAHNFTNGDCVCGELHDHVWATEWTVGKTTHYHACTVPNCTAKNDEAAHDFTNGDCVCGKLHEHVWATEWTIGETTHYHVCMVNGCTTKNDETTHDFTNGDCVCGELHDHVWATEWTIGETTHYHVCTVPNCTAKNDEAAHDFTNGDCICGKLHEHVWATEWTIEETTHYHACIVAGCTEKNDEAAHDFTNGDCICGKLHDHVWTTEWTIGETTHYHACMVNGCTAKNDEAAHDFTNGDCVCGKLHEHVWATNWTVGETTHYHACVWDECDVKNAEMTHNLIVSICVCGLKNFSEGLKYTLSDNEEFYICTGIGTATDTNIIIANYIKGDLGVTKPVTSISDSAFSGCSSIKSLTIPDSVTSIGHDAFLNTAWYDNHPDGLVYAGKVAYKYKGTMPDNTSITITKGTKGIAENAFNHCSGLKSITIPDSVTFIGRRAFEDCSGLTEITFPDSVTSIGSGVLSGCSGLTSIALPFVIEPLLSQYDYPLCTLFATNSSTGKNIVIALYDHSSGCTVTFMTYSNIPMSLRSVMITGGNIPYRAFQNLTMLTSITIPDSVTSIGYEAFYGCSGLTSITIPDSVTSIGEHAFENCSGLANIKIPDSVTSIGNSAFSGCPIANATVPASAISYIPKSSLKTVVITSGDSIGSETFRNCTELTSITIGNSVTSIGSSAFYGCSKLKSINYTGDLAGWCAINGLDELMQYASASRTLYIDGIEITGKLTIPNSITSISSYAFCACGGLTSITISDSVTYIGNYAFYVCGLDSVYYKGSVDEWNGITIGSYNGNLTDATRYYYSETEPTDDGNYWHYDSDGVTPVIWIK